LSIVSASWASVGREPARIGGVAFETGDAGLDHGAQGFERQTGAGELGGGGRHAAAGGARRLADESASAGDGAGGDSAPCGAPEHMRVGHHRLAVDALVGLGEHLLGGALGAQDEADAAGAAHAEGVPGLGRLERVVLAAEDDEDLVGFRRAVRAARRRDERVGLAAVGNAGGVALQRNAAGGHAHRRFARADVGAVGAFGGRGGEQQLTLGDLAQERELPRGAARVAHEAGELHVVHGEDHRGRGAGAAENRADVDDVGGARAFAAELGGNQHAEQPLLADGGEGFGGEARFAVDRVGVLLGDRRDRFSASDEVARSRRLAGSRAGRAGRERSYVMAHDANSGSWPKNGRESFKVNVNL
jgi:hypothetical protein